MTNTIDEFKEIREKIKEQAENDIVKFVELIRPELYLGEIHKLVLRQIANTKDTYFLLMIPRGHLKSQMMAILCAYFITKEPDITILYCSENTAVTQGQILMIKNMLTSPTYRMYWPEMVEEKSSRRTKWTQDEFTVDHPIRKNNLSVRECTVSSKTVGQSFTGAHYDLAIIDDAVTKDNAYTDAGRQKVIDFFGAMMAIMSGGNSRVIMAGTPYHPKDLYTKIEQMEFDDDDGERKKLFTVRKEVVEKDGVFLWPLGQAADGKWYGFNNKILSIKREATENKMHFFSQYYMNPNALDGQRIGYNNFKYYNPNTIRFTGDGVMVGGKELYVTAAMDFAFSIRKSADSSVIVVAGMDKDKNVYVLDIVKFKTNKINVMYQELIKCYREWGFKKIRCETVAAQEAVVEQLKDYMKERDVRKLEIIKYKPNRHGGTKEERMAAALEPIYQEERVYHNKVHRYNNAFEEELVSINPAHDDMKNAFADCMLDLRVPYNRRRRTDVDESYSNNSHSMFGGYN